MSGTCGSSAPTCPAGRVTGFETSLLDDEIVFITPDDIEELPRFGCQIADQVVLTREPKFVGDAIAAVVAPTLKDARVAASLVEVSYEERTAVYDELAALWDEAPLVHERHHTSESDSAYFDMRPQDGTNVCHRFRIRTPNLQGREEVGVVTDLTDPDEPLADAFDDAEVIVDEVFHTPAAAHVPMEPHATNAQWVDGRLEVVTGTQTPFNMRQDLAGIFGIAAEDVRIVVPPMGGAFGAKTFIRTEAITALAARLTGRPVRCVLDRDEVFNEVTRHPATVRVRLGAKRDGTFVAKRIWAYVNTGAYADCGPGVAQKMGYAGVGPYRFDHVAVDSYCIYTNLPPGGAFRGYGAMQSVWASERVVDMMADQLGIDAVELRRQNLLREGDTFCTGEVMHDAHFEELLDDAAAAVDWKRDGDRAGKGVAIMLKGMQTPSKAEARIELLPDGRYEVQAATADMGQGASEMLTRLAAENLKCDDGPDRGLRPRHRPGALRHPHHLEPLHPHDEPRAGGRRPRPARARQGRTRLRLQRRRPRPRHRAGRGLLALAPGLGVRRARRRRGHRRHRALHALRLLLRGKGRQQARRRAPAGGLDDPGPGHRPVRGAAVHRGTDDQPQPLGLQHRLRARRAPPSATA